MFELKHKTLKSYPKHGVFLFYHKKLKFSAQKAENFVILKKI